MVWLEMHAAICLSHPVGTFVTAFPDWTSLLLLSLYSHLQFI